MKALVLLYKFRHSYTAHMNSYVLRWNHLLLLMLPGYSFVSCRWGIATQRAFQGADGCSRYS